MSKQPKALELAEALDTNKQGRLIFGFVQQDMGKAAAELRRLHSLNAELEAQVNALRADAERYQFIKQCSPEPRVGDICPTILLFGLQGYPEDQWNNSALESKNLDAAIDSAKEAQQ